MYNYLKFRLQPFIFIMLAAGLMVSCKKSEAPKTVSYSAKMGGIRNWHGTDSTNFTPPFNMHDTVVIFNDTFALTVVDDTTVVRLYSTGSGDTLHYVSTDSVAKTYHFHRSYFDGMWYGSIDVLYGFSANNMTWESSAAGRAGSNADGKHYDIKLSTP